MTYLGCHKIRNETTIEVATTPGEPEYLIDFAQEKITELNAAPTTKETKELNRRTLDGIYPGMPPNGRNTGIFAFRIKGNEVSATSLKAYLLRALYCIECEAPGTLEKLSQIRNQTKRIAARDRISLFKGKEAEFIEKHSFDLGNGYFVGTNNSADEVDNWLRKAVATAGLTWGTDFKAINGVKPGATLEELGF
jgi:hypothetical protein